MVEESQPTNGNGGGCDENDGDRLTVLFAMFSTITVSKTVCRSMPFLNAVCTRVSHIRMIDPDKRERSPASSYGYGEKESDLFNKEFYGRINEFGGKVFHYFNMVKTFK